MTVGFSTLTSSFEVSPEGLFMVMVVGQCRVDLAKGEIGVIQMHLLGTPAIGDSFSGQLYDFHRRVGNQRYAFFVKNDMLV